VEGGEGVIQLALHRFRGAELTDERVKQPKRFKLDDYINDRPRDETSSEYIDLKFKAGNSVIDALRETPLSHNQGLCPADDDRIIVSARVKETERLRWWLLGFGAQLEVLHPTHLREWFKVQAEETASVYR